MSVSAAAAAAGRYKQTECHVCLRKMRPDNLKRNMLKHRELHNLDEEEIRDEIKRRKKLRETREAREQLVRQIADEEGFPHEYCDIDTPDTEEGPLPVEEELIKDDQTYTGKIERGMAIWKILEQGSMREDSLSLSKDNREALKIYRKNTPMRNLSNAELRIWQQQLLDNISGYWVKQGTKIKHGSRDI